MASVFQEVILDKLQATPGENTRDGVDPLRALDRDDGNCGLLVTTASTQTNRNKEAFASVTVQKTSANNDIIIGVLGDYHNNRQVSLCRKGRAFVASTAAFQVSDIGKGIRPSAVDNMEGKAEVSSSGIGEILGGGTHRTIGTFLLVDLNLP